MRSASPVLDFTAHHSSQVPSKGLFLFLILLMGDTRDHNWQLLTLNSKAIALILQFSDKASGEKKECTKITSCFFLDRELLEMTCRLGNTMRRQGVKKGDRVTIYMPSCPMAVASMLACARIGAIHTVVFAGFSSAALADRIQDGKSYLRCRCVLQSKRCKCLVLRLIR